MPLTTTYKISIYHNNEFAGVGQITADNEIICPACLGPTQDDSDETYEAIQDAIEMSDDEERYREGRYAITSSVTRPDGEYSWVIERGNPQEIGTRIGRAIARDRIHLDAARRGVPHKAMERKAYYRIVDKLPCLLPRRGTQSRN